MLKIFLKLSVATPAFSELHDAMANDWKQKFTTTTTSRSKIILDTQENILKLVFFFFNKKIWKK